MAKIVITIEDREGLVDYHVNETNFLVKNAYERTEAENIAIEIIYSLHHNTTTSNRIENLEKNLVNFIERLAKPNVK